MFGMLSERERERENYGDYQVYERLEGKSMNNQTPDDNYKVAKYANNGLLLNFSVKLDLHGKENVET